MKLTGVRTIIHIEDMNDAEKNFLQNNGFEDMQETDIADNEMWEHILDFNTSKQTPDYKRIGSSLVVSSDGIIFLKLENGNYIDSQKQEYRFQNNEMILVSKEISLEMPIIRRVGDILNSKMVTKETTVTIYSHSVLLFSGEKNDPIIQFYRYCPVEDIMWLDSNSVHINLKEGIEEDK